MAPMLISTCKLLTFANPRDQQELRHNALVEDVASYNRRTAQGSILYMVDALNRFSIAFTQLDWNEERTGPGADGYAHAPFLEIAQGIQGLLNIGMESNALHSGKVFQAVSEILKANGYTEDDIA